MIKDIDHKFNKQLMFHLPHITMFHLLHIIIKVLLPNKFEKNQEKYSKMYITHDKFNQLQQIKEHMKEMIEISEVYLARIVMEFNKPNQSIKNNNLPIKDKSQNWTHTTDLKKILVITLFADNRKKNKLFIDNKKNIWKEKLKDKSKDNKKELKSQDKSKDKRHKQMFHPFLKLIT